MPLKCFSRFFRGLHQPQSLKPRPSQLDLPSYRTVGVQIGEAAEGPDGEDVSVGSVAYSTALVEYTCNVLLRREGNSHISPWSIKEWPVRAHTS